MDHLQTDIMDYEQGTSCHDTGACPPAPLSQQTQSGSSQAPGASAGHKRKASENIGSFPVHWDGVTTNVNGGHSHKKTKSGRSTFFKGFPDNHAPVGTNDDMEVDDTTEEAQGAVSIMQLNKMIILLQQQMPLRVWTLEAFLEFDDVMSKEAVKRNASMDSLMSAFRQFAAGIFMPANNKTVLGDLLTEPRTQEKALSIEEISELELGDFTAQEAALIMEEIDKRIHSVRSKISSWNEGTLG